MPRFDMFTDPQRRHLAHIYAALRECIADEVEYDREPEFPPLDDDTRWAVATMIGQQLTELMFAAHAEEAAAITAEIEEQHEALSAAMARAEAHEKDRA